MSPNTSVDLPLRAVRWFCRGAVLLAADAREVEVLSPDRESVAAAYDRHYVRPNHFGYRKWMYRSYIRALVRRAGLRSNASVLDAGCGQGFFTALFAEQGFDCLGMDLSDEGIRSAREQVRRPNARFLVGDILDADGVGHSFDCVFTRSCSLYNVGNFAADTTVTDRLLMLVKPGGVLIFDYFTRLHSTAGSDIWRYHSIEDLNRHFAKYAGVQTFFSLRLDTVILRSLGISRTMSILGQRISRTAGVGGELIAIVRKEF